MRRPTGVRLGLLLLLSIGGASVSIGCAGAPKGDGPDVPSHGSAIEPSRLPDATDTIFWSSPELRDLRFDAVQVVPLQIGLTRERIESLGVTEERALQIIDLFWSGWIESAEPLFPETELAAAERPLRITASLVDRQLVDELDTRGSAIQETNGRLARVCLLFELYDWDSREKVAAILTQRDANRFEAILRGERTAGEIQQIFAPHLRNLQTLVVPAEARR